MEGWTDVQSYGRTVTKTKFACIDGLPYFLNYGAPRARSSAIKEHSTLTKESRKMKVNQAPVIRKVDNAIHWIIQLVLLVFICWIVIYPGG